MLTAVLAHAGQPLAPHDLWSAWPLHPAPLLGLVLAAWAYRRGTEGRQGAAERWRARCFAVALAAIGVALLSPLDPLSGALASAHMVQHVLLVLVAAPLLALSGPSASLRRGSPVVLRQAVGRWRRRLRLTGTGQRAVRAPGVLWLVHVGTLWFWHAAVPYEAALESTALHVVEHLSFLVTAVAFWSVVVGPGRDRVPGGLGVLLVFGMALQSVFLSALLTFASEPWYSAYTATAPAWGLSPLDDQRLAGLVMWVPGGFVYLGAALALLTEWVRTSEGTPRDPAGIVSGRTG